MLAISPACTQRAQEGGLFNAKRHTSLLKNLTFCQCPHPIYSNLKTHKRSYLKRAKAWMLCSLIMNWSKSSGWMVAGYHHRLSLVISSSGIFLPDLSRYHGTVAQDGWWQLYDAAERPKGPSLNPARTLKNSPGNSPTPPLVHLRFQSPWTDCSRERLQQWRWVPTLSGYPGPPLAPAIPSTGSRSGKRFTLRTVVVVVVAVMVGARPTPP